MAVVQQAATRGKAPVKLVARIERVVKQIEKQGQKPAKR
jgi:hypothetical protein